MEVAIGCASHPFNEADQANSNDIEFSRSIIKHDKPFSANPLTLHSGSDYICFVSLRNVGDAPLKSWSLSASANFGDGKTPLLTNPHPRTDMLSGWQDGHLMLGLGSGEKMYSIFDLGMEAGPVMAFGLRVPKDSAGMPISIGFYLSSSDAPLDNAALSGIVVN
jgi:hypothetical protein